MSSLVSPCLKLDTGMGDTHLISCLDSNISDWLYMRDGKMVGNETLKPLLKQMPAAEVKRLKSIMAEP